MRPQLVMLVIAAWPLAIASSGAEEYRWKGAGWYMLDSSFHDDIVDGPFGSEDKCRREVAATAKNNPKDGATLYCRYIGA